MQIRRVVLFWVFVLLAASLAQAQEEIFLWPGGAPGSPPNPGEVAVRMAPGDEHVLSNIHKPSITVYLPPADKATGAALIVAPGGGHRELWVDHEGHNVAKWLSDHGVAAFVLKYRLAKEDKSPYTIEEHALGDAQRAIRTVRKNADKWHLDPKRIGIIGFSAGGEVAALASARAAVGPLAADDPIDKQDSRPDFQALIYPGQSQNITATKDSPPAFLVCGYGDRPDISEGLADVYLKFKKAGVPAELHIYSAAGHGFGVRESNHAAVSKWPDRLLEWMEDRGLLKSSDSKATEKM
ncbi:MAG TPA: alpha/beta hydrolase [Lacipirellulaceae bacterium]|jgi:endo-1,4-beta-xylanase